jgi:hypothetical protein
MTTTKKKEWRLTAKMKEKEKEEMPTTLDSYFIKTGNRNYK